MKTDTARSVVLLGLFLASGCSALIYEIIWFQQLSLVFGASAVSLAILLSSFMGGMFFGSLMFSFFISTRHHPLRVYATIELLIGVYGISLLWLFPIIGRIYCSLSAEGASDIVLRSIIAAIMLLPPTALMGATLPAISRWVKSDRTGMAWLGWFYGANTFGAVAGSMFAGMYLLRVHDVFIATYVAVAMNLGIALLAYRLAAKHLNQELPTETLLIPLRETSRTSGGAIIHLVIGLSGFTALGAEVIWTRHLGLLLGPTVYTFSIILSVFLLGLGLGNSAGAVIGRRVSSPEFALAMTQLLLMAAIPYAAYLTIHVVPYWLTLHGQDELFTVRMTRDFVRVMATLLPATFLWGASFPLAVAAMAGKGREPSRLVGGLYAANTLGAIAGSLGVSLFAIPFGGQFVHRLLTIVCGFSAISLLGTTSWSAPQFLDHIGPRPGRFKRYFGKTHWIRIASLIVPVTCGAFAYRFVPAVPNSLLADGRFMNQRDYFLYYLYVAEGLDSPIVISEQEDGIRSFHIAGKIEASTNERDIRTQRMLGHLPAMAHPSPRKVLVVGCGSGMTAGSFLLHPSVNEIVICEMEKCVIEASRANFAEYNYGVLDDPRTRVIHDDARHFLATTREKYDIITTDPIHPWVKGAATLYTTEFFQLCNQHLTENGIATLWVPLYESNKRSVKCELATFLQVFPHSTIWSGQSSQVGYDLVVVGSSAKVATDVQSMVDRLSENERLRMSFGEVGLGSDQSLRDRFTTYGSYLKDWLQDSQINRDSNLRLQYLAGSNPDHAMEQSILEAITNASLPQTRR